jgi:lipopolysaccharide export system protein LptC
MRLAIRGSAERGPRMPSRHLGSPVFIGTARRTGSVVAVDRRHTRRVVVLKRALPTIGVALLLLIAIWPRLEPLWERMRFSFPAIDLRDARELRMINPRYSGIDREGRPFVVTAASGRQIPDREDLMSLQAPAAEIKLRSGAQIHATAISGVYQSQTSLIDLFGNVTVTHQDGTRFVTQTARVNAAQNAAEGSDPVSGNGPAGEIEAKGFRIIDRGDTIIFTGHADMLLNGARRIAPKRVPPVLPAPVVQLASQVVEVGTTRAATVSRPATSRRSPGKAAARSRPHTGAPARKKR